MSHPPLAPGHIDAPHLEAELGDLRLECGDLIRGYRQSYVTHGSPAAKQKILVCISLTGTHHRLDFLIGPGRALDPDQAFIVVADPIGNGLSTSPSNSTAQPGMRFPRFTLRDMIQAQYRLLTEHLGIPHVRAIVGASMGGMQALQWGVSHPGFADRLVAMTPMAKTSPWAAMVTEAARSALMADPAWNGSAFTAVPERGWRAWAAMKTALLMRSPAALEEHLKDAAHAHRWFEDVLGQIRSNAFDAHDYLYQSRAYDAHDVGTTPGFGGNTVQALGTIRARTLLLAPPLDLFNPSNAAIEAAKAIPGGTFVEIPSIQGHQAATSNRPEDAAFLNRVIAEFLAA